MVLTSTHFSDENAEKLNELDMKRLSLYDEADMEGVYNMITTLGEVLNRQEKAAKLIADMQETVATVKDQVNGLDTPSVYYVVGFGDGGDYAATGDTFIHGLIETAGGNNIAKDATNWSYTREKLIEADPDMIVVRKGQKEEFSSTEGYKELTAVKEGHVYEIDNNLLDRQGYRNAEGVMELAKIFHPEAFK